MASEKTREELLAQVAALQLELAQRPANVFTPEVSGVAPSSQPSLKTSQARGRIAVPAGWLTKSTDPVVIQGQIDNIMMVMASGVNSAGYGDKRTEFRSLVELRQILDGLQDDLAELLGARKRSPQVRMTLNANKGL
jgi:hypothetical protein